MATLRALASHLSYANVVATMALLLSLGGVSYAALALPAGSVGPRQLRAGAVTHGALGFSLGAAAVTNQHPLDLAKTVCNTPVQPGEVPAPCPASLLLSNPGDTVSAKTRSPGRLLVSTIASVQDQGAAGTSAQLTLDISVDGRRTARELTLAGGQQLDVPMQLLVRVGAGSHVVGLGSTVQYTSTGPGDVIVGPVSMVAVALPALPR